MWWTCRPARDSHISHRPANPVTGFMFEVTSHQKPLLAPVSAGGSWRDTAIMGGSRENDGALGAGYVEAAHFLAERWKSHRPNDRLAVPILGIYRHGIEPVLKDGIRTAAEFARRDGDEDPALGPARPDEKPATTHSIGALAEKLTALLGRLGMGPGQELPADTLEVLQSLHVLDESGQTFRYAAVKAGGGGAQARRRPPRPGPFRPARGRHRAAPAREAAQGRRPATARPLRRNSPTGPHTAQAGRWWKRRARASPSTAAAHVGLNCS
jgi:hypothetical protein